MTKASFKAGMLALAKAYNRTLDEATSRVYFRILGPLSDEDWQVAVDGCLTGERWWPPPSVLLDYARPKLGADAVRAKVMVRAQEVYEAIVDLYERGEEVSHRYISKTYGSAAADAFMVAGGASSFAWCDEKNEVFRRKAFIENFQTLVHSEPAAGLPSGERPALNWGEPDPENRLARLKREQESGAL